MTPNGYTNTPQTLVEMTLFIVALLVFDALLLTYVIYPSLRRLARRSVRRTPKEF